VLLYKRARKGETVEREPRLIHIYEFTLLGFRPPQVDFRVRCTKGTYVRTLCSDIGEALGCGACLEQLRRTTCGDIRIEEATPLDQLLAMSREDLGGKVIPLSRFRPRP
jgi:tRNA pseudouridine55 synthase